MNEAPGTAPPPTPSEPPAPAPRPHKALIIVTALVFLALIAGFIALHAFGYHVPTEAELRAFSATNPGVTVRPWQYIILHHSAADTGDAASIDADHRENRHWQNGLGYDFVIGNGTGSRNGQIEVGDRWKNQLDGAHCKADNMNQRAIGICLIGDFETRNGPTSQQVQSAAALIRYLARRFDIRPDHVLGHREVKGADTLCPGRYFPLIQLRSAAERTLPIP